MALLYRFGSVSLIAGWSLSLMFTASGLLAQSVPTSVGVAPGLQERNPRYQISRGDVIDIAFPVVPEFNQTVTVQPDGYIALKGIDGVHVAGQTTPELV